MQPTVADAEIEAAILELLDASGRSVAPIEVAHRLSAGTDSHRLIPAIRRIAMRLAGEGRVVFLRKGRAVEPAELKGVYRLGLPPASADGPGTSSAV